MAFMTTVIKVRQSLPPGRRLVIMSAPSIERLPAVGSRGAEAAKTPPGASGDWGCHLHVLMSVMFKYECERAGS